MKVVTVVGARPQFIKASALSREFRKHTDIEEIIIHTGQHFDDNMSDVFFREMDIPAPKYQLDIHSLGHGAMTGRMLEGIEEILVRERPDYTLVYGDTNSTLAGALAAKKLHIQVAHVEAGLRSFNMDMPEEINRIITDRISDILFCPTESAVQNLKKEGFEGFGIKVIRCGDIMYDAALFYKAKSDRESTILSQLGLSDGDYILATVHRQENTDQWHRLLDIVAALDQINEESPVVVPLHPRTRKLLEQAGVHVRFKVIDPVGYLDMIALTSHAALVLTDSGGLQKEAYFFGKYCVTMRDQTEWTELTDGGFNLLVGADKFKIYDAYQKYAGKVITEGRSLYGDGHTARTIADLLYGELNI